MSATAGQKLSPAVIVVGETVGAPLFMGMGECRDVDGGGEFNEGAGGGKGDGGGDDEGGGLLIDRYETFLLDMDGVLWEGGHVLPGAVEAGGTRYMQVVQIVHPFMVTGANDAAPWRGLFQRVQTQARLRLRVVAGTAQVPSPQNLKIQARNHKSYTLTPRLLLTVAEMKKRGKRVLFVTNNSARTRAQVSPKPRP